MTPELELILAEGAGMQPGYTTQKVRDKCRRCKLGQISLSGLYFLNSTFLGSHRIQGTYS